MRIDEERVGRAFIEYCAAPLAIFMTAGLASSWLNMIALDPMENFLPFYVVNFWLVMGVYLYRQKYRPDIVFDTKKEVALALFIGLTWIGSQPFLLLAGYGLFLKAVLQQDKVAPFLHDKLLPDIPNPEQEETWDIENL